MSQEDKIIEFLPELNNIVDLEECKKFAKKIVMRTNTKQEKKISLCRRIDMSYKRENVISLIYNMILAGEQHGSFESNWQGKQKQFGSMRNPKMKVR